MVIYQRVLQSVLLKPKFCWSHPSLLWIMEPSSIASVFGKASHQWAAMNPIRHVGKVKVFTNHSWLFFCSIKVYHIKVEFYIHSPYPTILHTIPVISHYILIMLGFPFDYIFFILHICHAISYCIHLCIHTIGCVIPFSGGATTNNQMSYPIISYPKI